MNILFVTDLYPIDLVEKNTPKTLYKFVKDWQNLGHNVQVLKPNFLLNSFLRKKPFYKTGSYNDVFNVNYATPFMFDVTKKLPHFKYDVIVAHMPSGIIFANKLKGNLICAVHSSDIEVLTNPVYSFYFKSEMIKAYNRASKIACRSEALKAKFLNLFPNFAQKTFVASSGIEKNIIKKRELKNDFSSKTVKMLTCAQLIKRKNVKELILAVKDMQNIELTVIGEGVERKNLEKLSKNVKFTGYLNHEKVLEYMENSDIFVLPSVGETFGMVYLEAMASGCITVGIENEGIAGIIKNEENGFLTKANACAIQNTIKNIMSKDINNLNLLLNNSYNTVKTYISENCSENYLNKILKIM